jgi:hypothetical protein
MDIVIKRGDPVALETLPEYSIALDGFVQGPKIDEEAHRFSFDHHAGCLRYCTTAACMQARDAVLAGLDPEPYTIFCNDVDADVCAAVWCLKNPTRCTEPLVNQLIDAIGKADMFAGAVGLNGMRKTVEWICEPEVASKRNGDYEKLSDEGLNPILESILGRIDLYVDGKASAEIAKQQMNENFQLLRRENNWALIESQDPHALSAIWQAGFTRVVVIRPLADKSTAVTIARKSDFVDGFPLPEIYDALNAEEKGWGGSSTIGGAPRNPDGSRSRLPVKKIVEIIDAVMVPETAVPSKGKRPTRPPKAPAKKKA